MILPVQYERQQLFNNHSNKHCQFSRIRIRGPGAEITQFQSSNFATLPRSKHLWEILLKHWMLQNLLYKIDTCSQNFAASCNTGLVTYNTDIKKFGVFCKDGKNIKIEFF